MSLEAHPPIEYNRTFSLHFYWQSHGLLLLRSGKTNEHPTRVDILFSDVRWMALPVWFRGIRIERGEYSDIPISLTANIKEEAHYMTTYKVTSQGVLQYLLASDNVLVVEDEKLYHEDSLLLPNHDFRAFVAPL